MTCNNVDGDVTKSYRMDTQIMFECVQTQIPDKTYSILQLSVSHKYNSNSLAAELHTNKSNAAGNSKRLCTSAVDGCAYSERSFKTTLLLFFAGNDVDVELFS